MDSRLIFLRHPRDVDQRGDGIRKAGGRSKMFVALLEVRCRKIRTDKDREPG
jgi:hypothetical protein